jgi:hypothetical protein
MSWTLSFNTKGPAGTSVASGSGAPTGSGVAGQPYVDLASGDTYQYTNGAWSKVGNIRGPIGLNGISGSFFTGTGAPTTSTYSGTGQAIYIQSTGEVWTYTSQSQGWVDSGETLVGPQGTPGTAGTAGNKIYHGAGAPTNSSTYNTGDVYYDTNNGDVYFF